MTSQEHALATIDTRIDDIQIKITDQVRRRVEDAGLSLDEAAARMQVDLSTLARVKDPRTALRLSVPQAIDVAYKAGLDLELQTTIQLDGLTLFHGGALKRSAYADAAAMMGALQAEAEKALLTHLSLNGLTIEDFEEAIKDQRAETGLDFSKATGAERMLAFLDYRGCRVEVASRIYDAPEANLIANPDAAKRVAPVTDPTPAPQPAPQPVAKTEAPVAKSSERPSDFGWKAPKYLHTQKPKHSLPTEPAPETGEQEAKSAQDVARRIMLAAQKKIAEAFAIEVEKTGLSHEEVASILEVKPMWVRQLCSDDWSYVSLRKTLELSRKLGFEVELSVSASLDGETLTSGGGVQLSQHEDSAELLAQLTNNLQSAITRVRDEMRMTNQEMADETGVSDATIKALTKAGLSGVSPQRALGILQQFGCEISVTAVTPHHPAPTVSVKEDQAVAPAPKQSVPQAPAQDPKIDRPVPKKAKILETAKHAVSQAGSKLAEQLAAHPASILGSRPQTAPGDVFEAHRKTLVDGFLGQFRASRLSYKEAGDLIDMPANYVRRAAAGDGSTMLTAMLLASRAGIETSVKLRIGDENSAIQRELALQSTEFRGHAEFLTALAERCREALQAIVVADGRKQMEIAASMGITAPGLSQLCSSPRLPSAQSLLSAIEKLDHKVEVRFTPSYTPERNKLRESAPEVASDPTPSMR